MRGVTKITVGPLHINILSTLTHMEQDLNGGPDMCRKLKARKKKNKAQEETTIKWAFGLQTFNIILLVIKPNK